MPAPVTLCTSAANAPPNHSAPQRAPGHSAFSPSPNPSVIPLTSPQAEPTRDYRSIKRAEWLWEFWGGTIDSVCVLQMSSSHIIFFLTQIGSKHLQEGIKSNPKTSPLTSFLENCNSLLSMEAPCPGISPVYVRLRDVCTPRGQTFFQKLLETLIFPG